MAQNTHDGGWRVNIVRAMKRNKGFQETDLRVSDPHQLFFALKRHPDGFYSAPQPHAHIIPQEAAVVVTQREG